MGGADPQQLGPVEKAMKINDWVEGVQGPSRKLQMTGSNT